MSLNVLVVDDSSVMRSVIIKTLRLSGVPLDEVHQAQNGEEGLAALEEHWIDLALIDINMPVMNGLDMLDKIRANPETKGLPVIVVSTEGSVVRVESIQKMGARFVHKPFSPVVLREAIVSVTGVSCGEYERESSACGDLDF